MAALRLAVNNTLPKVHPRLYQTMYYRSVHGRNTEWTRTGRAASPVGAIRASVVRLVTGQYHKAIIHGESGEVLYTLARKGREIKIFGLFMELDQ